MWREGKAFLFIGTHVDDFFCLFNKEAEEIRNNVLHTLEQTMEVTNKGEISHALDMKIERCREKGRMKISQRNFIENLLNEFRQLVKGEKLSEITEERNAKGLKTQNDGRTGSRARVRKSNLVLRKSKKKLRKKKQKKRRIFLCFLSAILSGNFGG